MEKTSKTRTLYKPSSNITMQPYKEDSFGVLQW